MKSYLPKILGNDSARLRIGSAIESGRLPHALMITGQSGAGKLTLAREISAALNCKARGDALPCGECDSCRRIHEGNFTDVKLIAKPKDRATIGVGAIKDFREDMYLSATESDYKIYIVDDAECMTVEAQNSLLKVLEEPPVGVVIMLLATEGDKILSTIRSRVMQVAMTKFSDDELRGLLIERSVAARELARTNPERLWAVVKSADGRIGEGLGLLDSRTAEQIAERRDDILALVSAMRRNKPFEELYLAVANLPTKRPELLGYIELWITALRDLIATRADSSRLLFFSDRKEAYEMAKDIGQARILSVYSALLRAHESCSKNAGVGGVVSALISGITKIQSI